MSKPSLSPHHQSGTNLASPVRYPACKADYTSKLMQGCQRHKKAEGRPLTETHEDDAMGVSATIDFSLDPCFYTGDRRRYGNFVPLMVSWRKGANIEPTWTVFTRIQTHRPSGAAEAGTLGLRRRARL